MGKLPPKHEYVIYKLIDTKATYVIARISDALVVTTIDFDNEPLWSIDRKMQAYPAITGDADIIVVNGYAVAVDGELW